MDDTHKDVLPNTFDKAHTTNKLELEHRMIKT